MILTLVLALFFPIFWLLELALIITSVVLVYMDSRKINVVKDLDGVDTRIPGTKSVYNQLPNKEIGYGNDLTWLLGLVFLAPILGGFVSLLFVPGFSVSFAFLLFLALIIISDITVYRDAKELSKVDHSLHVADMVFYCVLLWIVAYPKYVFARRKRALRAIPPIASSPVYVAPLAPATKKKHTTRSVILAVVFIFVFLISLRTLVNALFPPTISGTNIPAQPGSGQMIAITGHVSDIETQEQVLWDEWQNNTISANQFGNDSLPLQQQLSQLQSTTESKNVPEQWSLSYQFYNAALSSLNDAYGLEVHYAHNVADGLYATTESQTGALNQITAAFALSTSDTHSAQAALPNG